MKEYHQRALAVRAELKKRKLGGFIQPVNDRFQNEYIPAAFQRVPFISGFTGSAGYVVVLEKKAALFVDGRYTLQAANEVDKKLFSIFNIADKTPANWIVENLKNGVIGYDATVFTKSSAARYESALAASNLKFAATPNLIDAIWKNRPPEPCSVPFPYSLKFAGRSSQDKLKEITGKMKSIGAEYFLVTAPDSLCWLLNIRAADIPNTPFLLAYALVKNTGKVTLFLDKRRVTPELKKHLGNAVTIKGQKELDSELKKISKKRVLLDPEATPIHFFKILPNAVEAQDPCTLPKACKNMVEVKGIKAAHQRDGKALAKFIEWIKAESKKRPVGEIEAADKLFEFRKTNKHFIGTSFDTISGFGANGAIVHYHASQKSEAKIYGNGLYLLDSGGQYLDGTTDVTRTIAIGKPTAEQKRSFTYVLKGHIALALATFSEGTTGHQLDILARQFLWRHGLDYDHGTGHGVGCFLSVHEGPQRISKAINNVALQPGMIISNEPGYYKAGEYGIRIENLVLVAQKGKMENGKKLLGFETITCAPIDEELVDYSLLSPEESKWLKEYNAEFK